MALHRWVDDCLPLPHPFQSLPDLGRARVFREVSDRARLEGADHRAVVGVGSQHDHAYRRVSRAQPTRRLHSADPGHPKVHQDHVRLQFRGEGQRFLAVRGGAGHLHTREQRQEQGEPLADHALVIRGEHPDRRFTRPSRRATYSSHLPRAVGLPRPRHTSHS
jgi:hypothetical protein